MIVAVVCNGGGDGELTEVLPDDVMGDVREDSCDLMNFGL